MSKYQIIKILPISDSIILKQVRKYEIYSSNRICTKNDINNNPTTTTATATITPTSAAILTATPTTQTTITSTTTKTIHQVNLLGLLHSSQLFIKYMNSFPFLKESRRKAEVCIYIAYFDLMNCCISSFSCRAATFIDVQ